MLLIKILIACLIVFMVVNLFKAMIVMLKNDPSTPPMSKYIGRRMIFAILIIGFIVVAMATGLITPNPRPF
jgi:cytochrome b subunit of formate dehydrogenase